MSNKKIRVIVGIKIQSNIFSNILIHPTQYLEKEFEVDDSLSTDEIIQVVNNNYPKNIYMKFRNITVKNKT
jgi:hypothetical protein